MLPDSVVGFAPADWVLFLITGLLVLAVGWRGGVQRGFERLAQRRLSCAGLFFLLPIVLRLALLGNDPMPAPDSAEEFCNVLMADTLLHGRLTNPPHAMADFFETQRPASSLGIGLTLAAGRLVSGEPWTGVLLAGGVFCAFCYWMLRGWVTPEWALLGGMLAVMEFGPLCRWGNSYAGGYLAAFGGCVLFGLLPRVDLRTSKPLRMAVWGLAALAPVVFILLSRNGRARLPTMANVALYRFYFLPPLYLAILGFVFALRERKIQWIAATLALGALGMSFSFGSNLPAIFTCLFVLVCVVGLRQMSRWGSLGPDMVRILMALYVAEFLFLPYAQADSIQQRNQQRRIAVRREVAKIKGPLLVFVRYGPRHARQNEWVWNEADIDAARVVWAHDLGAAKNQELMRYYPKRKVLLLEPDEFIPRLSEMEAPN